MKVTIKDKEITLKYGFRALMIYENICGKAFTPATLTELVTFFAAVIIASDKDVNINIDDVITMLDEKPQLLNDFTAWLVDKMQRQDAISGDSGDTVNTDDEQPKN